MSECLKVLPVARSCIAVLPATPTQMSRVIKMMAVVQCVIVNTEKNAIMIYKCVLYIRASRTTNISSFSLNDVQKTMDIIGFIFHPAYKECVSERMRTNSSMVILQAMISGL